jgi:hypothetical protein
VNYDLPFTDYNLSELVQTKSPHKRNLQGSYAKKNWQLCPPSQPDFTGFMRRKKRQAIEN